MLTLELRNYTYLLLEFFLIIFNVRSLILKIV